MSADVAGSRWLIFAALRRFWADGLRTLLQSGNLIFETTDAEAMEARLENLLAERFGLATDVLVRTAGAWRALVAGNPFPEMAADDPGHLVAMPLKAEPTAAAVEALRAAIKGPERVAASGGVLYLHYVDGIGRSKLTNTVIERHVGCRGTGRNWNTVLKIAGALAG